MKNYKNYLIVTLGGLLAISLFTSSTGKSNEYATKTDLKNFQTSKEMKEVIASMIVEMTRLQVRINDLQDCLNNLEVDPGGSGREVVCL
jgi:hypothetical protein